MFRSICIALCLAAFVTPGAESAGPTDFPEPPVADVAAEVRKLREEIAELKLTMAMRDKAATLEYKMLSARLAAIEKSIRDLPAAPVLADSRYARERGTIKLINTLGVAARVTIGSRTYTVEANDERVIDDRGVGGFTYEVTADGMATTAPKRGLVEAGRVWKLTIF